MNIREGHPHPRLVRGQGSWVLLDGPWQFEFSDALTPPRSLTRTIRVPFAWETTASEIGEHWQEIAWYSRVVEIPETWRNDFIQLHFEAVHDHCTVWIDGELKAEHEGGQLPFTIELGTEVSGKDGFQIDVRVEAPADKRDIAHGKQRSLPRTDFDGVDFTPTSGIWKSVWMESVPKTYVVDAWAEPMESLQAFDVTVHLAGEKPSAARVLAFLEGKPPIILDYHGSGLWRGQLDVQAPQLWSPEDPHLYDIRIQTEVEGCRDEVLVYSGLRKIEFGPQGFFLNGRRRTLRAVLDQGYWPCTGMTPPSVEAIRHDLDLAREAGFNTVRKHIKLEDARFLRAADEMGILVWSEPASTGHFTKLSERRFHEQLPVLAQEVRHSPACVVVAAYNEEWGLDWGTALDPAKQEACRKAYRSLKQELPRHLVIDNSGWEHVETDVVDWHHYVDDPNKFADTVAQFHAGTLHEFPVILGPDFVVTKDFYASKRPSEQALPLMNSEYGGGFTPVERGWNMKWETQELRRWAGLGYVYTELYDVEHEPVGIYDINRSMKDNGGNPPDWIHADNVFVLNIRPHQPGRDLLVEEQGEVQFTWLLATDIGIPESTLSFAWTPCFHSCVPERAWQTVANIPAVSAPLSQEFAFATNFPTDRRSGRLHLQLTADGETLARSWIDIDTRKERHIGDY